MGRLTMRYGPLLILVSTLLGPVVFVRFGDRTPKLFWSDLLLIGLLIGEGATGSLSRWAWKTRTKSYLRLFVAYLLLGGASLIYAADPLSSLASWKLRVMAFAALAYIGAWGTRHGGLARVAPWISAASLLLALNVCWAVLLRPGAPASDATEVVEVLSSKDLARTPLGRSNYLASFLILCTPVSIAVSRGHPSSKWRKLAAAATAVGFLALVLTQSRGAILSLLLGGLGVWALWLVASGSGKGWTRARRSALVAGGLVCAAAIGWRFAPEEVRQDFSLRSVYLWEQWQEGNLAENRAEIWAAGARQLGKNPVVGLGLGNQKTLQDALAMYNTSHNLALDTLLELGAVGGIILGALLFAVGLAVYRNTKRGRGIKTREFYWAALAGWSIAILNAMQEPSFWAEGYSVWFWFLMGAAIAVEDRKTPLRRV